MRGLSDIEIAACFQTTFGAAFGVTMRGGFDEPVYLPTVSTGGAEIQYTRDYPASALHEAAHWCIAGARRRQQVDYGYFYEPPPRDGRARMIFQRVECNAQALESIFCRAAGIRFRVSADDLDAPQSSMRRFASQVAGRALDWSASGLPPRAERFRAALAAEWQRCQRIERGQSTNLLQHEQVQMLSPTAVHNRGEE